MCYTFWILQVFRANPGRYRTLCYVSVMARIAVLKLDSYTKRRLDVLQLLRRARTIQADRAADAATLMAGFGQSLEILGHFWAQQG